MRDPLHNVEMGKLRPKEGKDLYKVSQGVIVRAALELKSSLSIQCPFDFTKLSL